MPVSQPCALLQVLNYFLSFGNAAGAALWAADVEVPACSLLWMHIADDMIVGSGVEPGVDSTLENLVLQMKGERWLRSPAAKQD